jgi:Spy/CpxP family protein refolding chaperone
MSRLTVAAIGLATLLAAPIALAGAGYAKGFQGPGHHGPPSPEMAHWMADKALDEVEATDDQRAAIHDIFDDGLVEMTDIHERGHELREAFREAIDAGASAEDLEALRLEAVALFDEGSRVMVSHVAEARGELTDAQWQELQELRERFHPHR